VTQFSRPAFTHAQWVHLHMHLIPKIKELLVHGIHLIRSTQVPVSHIQLITKLTLVFQFFCEYWRCICGGGTITQPLELMTGPQRESINYTCSEFNTIRDTLN